MSEDYNEFLKSKLKTVQPHGFDVAESEINNKLFPFQRDIVRWALRRGRAAIFAECGMGKTAMQLEWAWHVVQKTGGKVLVLAPLAVASQTVAEGAKFGITVTHCREADDVADGINVINYDRLEKLDCSQFIGVVLDESSILKSYMGATRLSLQNTFSDTTYKLCCTATPAPNDYVELGQHASFLNVLDSSEMLARWFINDSMKMCSYRLKQHAEESFWKWLTSWACCVSKPSDIGYDDAGFVLPKLTIIDQLVEVDHTHAFTEGNLFLGSTLSAASLWKDKRMTLGQRCAEVARLVSLEPDEPWLIWCDTNDESALLSKLCDAVEVKGSDKPSLKEAKLNSFSNGTTRRLVTKPDIAGFGMNWQHCARVAFVGLTYSFEKLYQALRRTWRFGQTREVVAYMIVAETEGNVMKTISEKRSEHEAMQLKMTEAQSQNGELRNKVQRNLELAKVERDVASGDKWSIHLGDCVEVAREIADNVIDFSIFSPPFANLYIYSDSIADMGNSANYDEFLKHFEFLAVELHRITTPGRNCAVHCKDLPKYAGRDGAAGLWDFPGKIIEMFERVGWQFHSRVTIWKCPVTEMQRTKNHGLLYKNFRQRGEVSRQGMADYVVTFRKWEGVEGTESTKPVIHDPLEFPLEIWQEWASPVWMDVDQTNVLNYQIGKDNKDEKHICPLQLDVIERCIGLWTNRGDLVFSPFTGIGSEGFMSVKMQRRFVGAELKRSYFNHAKRNMLAAENEAGQLDLFSAVEAV